MQTIRQRWQKKIEKRENCTFNAYVGLVNFVRSYDVVVYVFDLAVNVQYRIGNWLVTGIWYGVIKMS